MKNDINDQKFAGEGPSAAYAFARNRMISLDAPPEVAHEAGLIAHLASVFGHDAKKDRNGNFIPQGIGSPGNETIGHYQGILKYEGREAYDRVVRAKFKSDPEGARRLGLQEPQRLGS